MGRSTTPSFCLTLKLNTSKRDEQILEYRFLCGQRIYNVLVRHCRKQFVKLFRDPGYRYGASIRKKKVNYEKSERNQDEQTEFCIKIKRSLPSHTRRAHWHHYWIGPKSGERKLILHWIAPVFVSGTESGVAVVHKVNQKI